MMGALKNEVVRLQEAVVANSHCAVEAMMLAAFGVTGADGEDFLHCPKGKAATQRLKDALESYADDVITFRDIVDGPRDVVPGTDVLRCEYRDGSEDHLPLNQGTWTAPVDVKLR